MLEGAQASGWGRLVPVTSHPASGKPPQLDGEYLPPQRHRRNPFFFFTCAKKPIGASASCTSVTLVQHSNIISGFVSGEMIHNSRTECLMTRERRYQVPAYRFPFPVNLCTFPLFPYFSQFLFFHRRRWLEQAAPVLASPSIFHSPTWLGSRRPRESARCE